MELGVRPGALWSCFYILLINNRRERIKRQKTGIEMEASVGNREYSLGIGPKILLVKDIREIIKRQKTSKHTEDSIWKRRNYLAKHIRYN